MWTWECAPEVRGRKPMQCHPARVMHPAVFPEVRIVPGGLLVNDACNFGALNEDDASEKVAVSEVNHCLR